MLSRHFQWHERCGNQIIHVGEWIGGETVEVETVHDEPGYRRRVYLPYGERREGWLQEEYFLKEDA